jgi:hypothetical protein
MGGGLLLHRHFVLRSDFEIGIATPNPAQSAPVFHRFIQEPTWLERLKRTRLAKWFHDYTHLVYARQFSGQLLSAAREFQPDLIFNVAETWVSFHALKLARKLFCLQRVVLMEFTAQILRRIQRPQSTTPLHMMKFSQSH